MGDVMGDLNSRRGRILGMNPTGKKQVITAHVPLSELTTYSRQLNSITQGRGTFEMEFDHTNASRARFRRRSSPKPRPSRKPIRTDQD